MAIEKGKHVWHRQSWQEMIVVREVPQEQDKFQKYWECSYQNKVTGEFVEKVFPESMITEKNPLRQQPPPRG